MLQRFKNKPSLGTGDPGFRYNIYRSGRPPLLWWPPHVQTGHHHNSENQELALPSSSLGDKCSKRCPLCSEMYADYVFEKMMDPSSAASVSFEALIADRLELRLFQVRSTRLQRFLRAFLSPQCASYRELSLFSLMSCEN